MPDVDREIEVLFPLAGINVATEFGRQPKATTPVGENVRAFDVLAKRGRGGSRPGLTKYLPPQLPSGHHVVQHLTVVVDPQEPGLLTDDDVDGGSPYPEVLDPSTNNNAAGYGDRNPGRYVRVGGSGKPQNRHASAVPQITLVSHFNDGDGNVTLGYSLGGGGEVPIQVFAVVPGVTPTAGSTTGMFVVWYVDDLSPISAAVQGSITNSPPVVVTLTQQVDAGPTTYFKPSFSVAPGSWTN